MSSAGQKMSATIRNAVKKPNKPKKISDMDPAEQARIRECNRLRVQRHRLRKKGLISEPVKDLSARLHSGCKQERERELNRLRIQKFRERLKAKQIAQGLVQQKKGGPSVTKKTETKGRSKPKDLAEEHKRELNRCRVQRHREKMKLKKKEMGDTPITTSPKKTNRPDTSKSKQKKCSPGKKTKISPNKKDILKIKITFPNKRTKVDCKTHVMMHQDQCVDDMGKTESHENNIKAKYKKTKKAPKKKQNVIRNDKIASQKDPCTDAEKWHCNEDLSNHKNKKRQVVKPISYKLPEAVRMRELVHIRQQCFRDKQKDQSRDKVSVPINLVENTSTVQTLFCLENGRFVTQDEIHNGNNVKGLQKYNTTSSKSPHSKESRVESNTGKSVNKKNLDDDELFKSVPNGVIILGGTQSDHSYACNSEVNIVNTNSNGESQSLVSQRQTIKPESSIVDSTKEIHQQWTCRKCGCEFTDGTDLTSHIDENSCAVCRIIICDFVELQRHLHLHPEICDGNFGAATHCCLCDKLLIFSCCICQEKFCDVQYVQAHEAKAHRRVQ